VMWNGFGMGGFGMLIFRALAVLGIVWLIRWISDDSRRNSSPIFEREPSTRRNARDRSSTAR
jgi:hypothetical protein